MPAILPARLKKEAAELAERFSEPTRFLRALEDLLERYADRTRRPGQSGAPAPLLPAYQVPTPVLRQIMVELTPLVETSPDVALSLADQLWEKPFWETRLLAIRLLGLVPATEPAPVLARVRAWAHPGEEERLLDQLFAKGTQRLRQENLDAMIALVKEWLGDARPEVQILGIKALQSLAEDAVFENLPLVFRLLFPHLSDPQSELRPYVLDVVRVLARRSPQETIHALRQALIVTGNPGTIWFARQVMPLFPGDAQETLREMIRNR